MTFLQYQKDLKRWRKHFRERQDQPERCTIDGSQVIAKKQKVCHFFLSLLQWLSPYFSFFSGDTSNFHQTIVIDSFFQSSICRDKKMPQDAMIGAKVWENSTSSKNVSNIKKRHCYRKVMALKTPKNGQKKLLVIA